MRPYIYKLPFVMPLTIKASFLKKPLSSVAFPLTLGEARSKPRRPDINGDKPPSSDRGGRQALILSLESQR